MRRIALPAFALLVGCAIGHTVARGPRRAPAPAAHLPVPREVTIRTTHDAPPVTVLVHSYRAAGVAAPVGPNAGGTPYLIYLGDDVILYGSAPVTP